MYCSHCGKQNDSDSKFCIHCGSRLHEVTGNPKAEDILFVPEKKSHTLRNTLIVIAVVVFLFFLIIGISSSSNNTNSSNSYDISPTPFSSSFPLYQLSIKNLDSEWSGYSNNILHIKGTLLNDSSEPAQNISIRIDFYKDKENSDLFDTRYITLTGVASNGAFSFNEPVLGFTADYPFWFQASITNAEKY